MKTAVDTSVILDVITDDPTWADASEKALQAALAQGPLVIGECVLAEIVPALRPGEMGDFLAAWAIEFLPSSEESATLAGEMYGHYLQRGGRKNRVVPDFLIGAHAWVHTRRLLARDRGYYRDYFSGLAVIDPGRG